jgi:glycosyltransferase involved in cell wall biosynthesis
MYPLDQGRWGATARISEMRDALAELTELEVIAGYRGARTAALARYTLSGRLRNLEGIYVESSSFLPSPADVAFLALARSLGIPVLTYVRDAQALFAEYSPRGSAKRWLSRRMFVPAFRALMAASTSVAFPSAGLAAAFGRGKDALLLPPGSPPPLAVPRLAGANQLLFVGGMRYPVHGLSILIEGVERARAAGHDVEVVCVSRPGEEPPPPRPAWLHVERGGFVEIAGMLPAVRASITPRLRSPYNDLGVPIKVMEYLSYGRPLLVTDCTEQARIVEQTKSGWVVPATGEGFARGICDVFAADEMRLDELSAAAREGARVNSWRARAEQVLHVLSLER